MQRGEIMVKKSTALKQYNYNFGTEYTIKTLGDMLVERELKSFYNNKQKLEVVMEEIEEDEVEEK